MNTIVAEGGTAQPAPVPVRGGHASGSKALCRFDRGVSYLSKNVVRFAIAGPAWTCAPGLRTARLSK